MAAPAPAVVQPIREELAQRATPNIDILSTARCPVSTIEEHTVFATKAKVEAFI